MDGVPLKNLCRVDRPEGDGAVCVTEGQTVTPYPGEAGYLDIVVVGETECCNRRVNPFCEESAVCTKY